MGIVPVAVYIFCGVGLGRKERKLLGSITTPSGVVLFNFAAMWELAELTDKENKQWQLIAQEIAALTQTVLNRRSRQIVSATEEELPSILNRLPKTSGE